jgi:glucokinase
MFRIGLDIGGTNIVSGVVDNSNKIISRRQILFPKGQPYSVFIGLIVNLIKEQSKELRIQVSDYKSIGICVPGSINREKGTVINAYNLEFHNVPMIEAMKTHFTDIPVFLENDANAATLAELNVGALRGYKTAVLFTIGTGIGGGIILGGKLFNGGMDHGVEPGHMIIDHNGPLCTCGNRGCIETLCSGSWLIKQGQEAIVKYPQSRIYRKTQGNREQVTGKLVIDCAKEGDEVAEDIFYRYVNQLSLAVVSCANLLDPEVIALGGGISKAGEFLFQPLRKLVREKSFFRFPYKIVPAELENDAGVIGAAMLGMI